MTHAIMIVIYFIQFTDFIQQILHNYFNTNIFEVLHQRWLHTKPKTSILKKKTKQKNFIPSCTILFVMNGQSVGKR